MQSMKGMVIRRPGVGITGLYLPIDERARTNRRELVEEMCQRWPGAVAREGLVLLARS